MKNKATSEMVAGINKQGPVSAKAQHHDRDNRREKVGVKKIDIMKSTYRNGSNN